MLILHILIFLGSCFVLTVSSKWVVEALSKIARFLGWKEFVVGFFTMAVATSLPNLFIGVVSALNKIPELSFGDIVGGNIFDLSLVVAISALVSRAGLTAKSRTVQGSAIFTVFVAVLPLILVADGLISRVDAILLIACFFVYTFWIFSKEDRFKKTYEGENGFNLKAFFKNLLTFAASAGLLILAAEGLVKSASFFVENFNISLSLVGMLVVAIGTSLPESFFSWRAAKKGEDWLLLGNLMGGVIIVSTLVLGTVALITPIRIGDFSPFAIARFFLIVSIIFFLLFLRTGRKITKKEAVFLLSVYISFVIAEILTSTLTK